MTVKESTYDAAKQFLELIAIVDDGPLVEFALASKAVTPRVVVDHTVLVDNTEIMLRDSPIDYDAISKAALSEGLFCALVRPHPLTQEGAGAVARTLLKADIIVLDWRIRNLRDGEFATWVIENLRGLNPGRKPQIVCIYSDLPNHAEGLAHLAKQLAIDAGAISDRRLTTETLSVIWLTKTVEAGDRVNATSAEDLPRALLTEFAALHEGLVPVLALKTLAAVRANARPLLDRYSRDADPGFVFDCALLGGIDEVAPGVRLAISDDLAAVTGHVSTLNPEERAEVIREWINERIGDRAKIPAPEGTGDNEAKLEWLLTAVSEGFSNYNKYWSEPSKRQNLAKAFLNGEDKKTSYEEFVRKAGTRFSALLATQYWPTGASAKLELGTIICTTGGDFLICIQPECDGLRLVGKTKFPFIPLKGYSSDLKNHLASPAMDDEPLCLFFLPSITEIVTFEFEPEGGQSVIQTSNNRFRATDDQEYRFIGRLRTPHGHRMLQQLTDEGGRVGVTEGELGRLEAKKSSLS